MGCSHSSKVQGEGPGQDVKKVRNEVLDGWMTHRDLMVLNEVDNTSLKHGSPKGRLGSVLLGGG